MRKIKFLISILVGILLVFAIKNVCFAETYYNPNEVAEMLGGLNAFVEANPGEAGIGTELKIAHSTLVEGEYLYCVAYCQLLQDPVLYKVVNYMEVGGKDETSESNKILAEILSGKYGNQFGDGANGVTYSYTDAQMALWYYFSEWVGGTGDSQFDGWGSAIHSGGAAIINAIRNNIENAGLTKVRIYFLVATSTSATTPYQRLIIAIPEPGEEELIIEKYGESSKEQLPNVSFNIKNTETGEYISKVSDASEETGKTNSFRVDKEKGYSKSESDAYVFKTGANGEPIHIIGLKKGIYQITELANPNEGYEKNVGKTWTVQVQEKTPNKIKIYNEKEDEPDPPEPDSGEGNVIIRGTVWNDSFGEGKAGTNNSRLGNEDKGIEGVLVKWLDSNGGEIASTWTDGSGKYEMKTSIEIGEDTYRISSQWERINSSYVEFTYNGLKYTTVRYGNMNDEFVSKGIEVEDDRRDLDSRVAEITYEKLEPIGIKSDLARELISEDKDVEYEKYKEVAVRAETKDVINHLVGRLDTESCDVYEFTSTKTSTYCMEHCYYDKQYVPFSESDPAWLEFVSGEYGGIWSKEYTYGDMGIVLGEDHNEYHELSDGCKDDVKWYDWDHDGERDEEEEEYYCAEDGHWTCGELYKSAGHCLDKTITGIKEWTIENVDLGLVEREQPDLAIESDIKEVRVIMNGQQYTYIYGQKGLGESNVKVQFTDDNATMYKRPVNPAHIADVIAGKSDIEVYVTYQIVVINQSNTLVCVANEIVNYYDPNYTVVSSGWSNTSKYGLSNSLNGSKAVYTQQLAGEQIQPQSVSRTIEIEFRVNDDFVYKLINPGDIVTYNNVSEIHTFSTIYGTKTICAEGKVGKYAGEQYAGIDDDSTPGSVTYDGKYEDDTSKSPTFGIIREDEYKILSGTVYEDSATNTSEQQRLGDGSLKDGEFGVADVKVELVRTVNGVDVLADLYTTKNGEYIRIPAITYTDANGNYAFGYNYKDGDNAENYPKFYNNDGAQVIYITNEDISASETKPDGIGIPVDNYKIRYTYGDKTTDIENTTTNPEVGQEGLSKTDAIVRGDANILAKGKETKINNVNKINARNYKSTIITDEKIKAVMQNDNSTIGELADRKWHLTIPDSKSIAVDDIEERIAIDNLRYGNFDTGVNMTAYSEYFAVQVEYTQEQVAKVNADGENVNFKHDWSTFDFGIIERPRENIVVNTTIENLKITLADGQILTEGNPYKDTMQYVKALGNERITKREDAVKAPRKLVSAEIDQEIIQGARVDLLYAITVTNNNEYDEEYNKANGGNTNYYYYGIKDENNIMNLCAEKVVQYLDEELVFDKEEVINQAWKKTSSDELLANGFISQLTYDTIVQNKYTVYETDRFKNIKPGESHTEQLLASRLLANQATEYTYENHAEIVEINGEVARTIDSTDKGVQITKQYKPGNYIPSLSRINAGTTNAQLAGIPNKGLTEWGTVNGMVETAGFHTQDDDMITLTITPPTGLTNNTIIYIMTLAIGLVALIVGINFIKKKVI